MAVNKLRKYFYKGKDNVYMCSICDKTKTSLLRMQNHILTHTEYECEVCSKKFKVKHHLDNHKVTHEKVDDIACSQCPKTFAHTRYLEQHMKNTHSEVKRFICEVCGKQFNQLVHLKTHSVSHKAQKPFSCEQCKRRYACKASLLRHCEVHDKKRPFVCQHCNKRFSRKETFVLHVQVIHELKKAHKCLECGVAFGQKAYLKAHYLRSHVKLEMETIKSKIKTELPRLDPDSSEVQLTFSISILKASSNESAEVQFHNVDMVYQQPSNNTSNNEHLMIDGSAEKYEIEEDVPKFIERSARNMSNVLENVSKETTIVNFENATNINIPDKELNVSNTLFTDSQALDILGPPNLETDFLLGSFGNWESTSSVDEDTLPVCPMDISLDSCQDFNSKDYLSTISDEYFSSLQCTMPF